MNYSILTIQCFCQERFDRQLAENATIIFQADRVDQDNEDPDTAATAHDLNVDNAIIGTDTGKAHVEHPLRSWATADDCVVLEVFNFLPFLYVTTLDPVSADPDGQVVENTTPLVVAHGKGKKTASRKRSGTAAGSSASPQLKRPKSVGNKPPHRDKSTPKEPPMSSGYSNL
jgi:hypothetical protein